VNAAWNSQQHVSRNVAVRSAQVATAFTERKATFSDHSGEGL
jgi:hypothetical protein